MVQTCEECGRAFAIHADLGGLRLDLRGRKRCLDCRPHRPQRKPRKKVEARIATKICDSCGQPFKLRQIIDGKLRYFYNRRFCADCSPFGAHNTSKHAPPSDPLTRRLRRRRRRTESFLRYQRKRRRKRKNELISVRGGRCEDCGYAGCLAVLEFHHRDPRTKEFGIGDFTGSTERLRVEAAKCDLLCANCHRIRHSSAETALRVQEMRSRRDKKARAISHMGDRCLTCGRDGPAQLFEFHHLDASQKDFGISEDGGISRRWEKIVAELAKCAMLCANCHREVHAGVRKLDQGPPGLAEGAGRYAMRLHLPEPREQRGRHREDHHRRADEDQRTIVERIGPCHQRRLARRQPGFGRCRLSGRRHDRGSRRWARQGC